MVLQEIVTRMWLQARIKLWRVRERIPGKGQLSEAGIPDLIGCVPNRPLKMKQLDQYPMPIQMRFMNIPGQAIFLEVKRPGGARRLSQKLFIEEMKQSGAISGFVESWSDVVALFGTFGIDVDRAYATVRPQDRLE